MCLDNNNSSLSVNYINAQYAALWENARKCADFLHGNGSAVDYRSTHYEKSRYTRALREFHHFGDNSRKQRTSYPEFQAIFDKPQIGFICNHDAVLLLHVEEARIGMENATAQNINRTTSNTQNTLSSVVKDIRVAFRIKFHRRKLSGRDPLVGNTDGRHAIQFIVLQLEPCSEPIFMEAENLGDVNKKALENYLKHYLKLLRVAGNHVLFDLPDFDDDKHRPTIDYSLDSNTDFPKSVLEGYETSIHSVKVSEVNQDLSRKWARATREVITGNLNVYDTCLARLNTTSLHGVNFSKHFFIQFSEPHIEALCSHEIIFIIRVESVWFFESEDFSQGNCGHFKNWTFAFIIDVSQTTQDNGAIIELELEFHKVRFSRVRSGNPDTDEAKPLFELLSQFLSVDYFDMLRSRALQSLHRVDLRVDVNIGIDSRGYEDESDNEEESTWTYEQEAQHHSSTSKQQIPDFGLGINVNVHINATNSSTFGLDSITSLPEETINDMYTSLYERARTVRTEDQDYELHSWENHSATFKMKVRGLAVRLLSGGQFEGKAIVLIKVESGMVAIKKIREAENTAPWNQTSRQDWEPSNVDDSQAYYFEEIMFAYKVQVGLTLVDDADEDLKRSRFHKRFESSSMYKLFSDSGVAHSFRHVVLAMRDFEFMPDLSQTNALGHSIEGVIRLELMQKYIYQYLEHLADRGDHVLRSLPVLTSYDKSLNHSLREKIDYAMTAHKFRVISKEPINPTNCLHKRDPSDSPALVVFGMCQGRDMPRLLAPTTTGWVPTMSNRESKHCGFVYIGKDVLLEGRLLDLFELFNRKTTLVDKGFQRGDQGWDVNLDQDVVLWTEDSTRKNMLCPWTRVSGSNTLDHRSLRYVWRYGDRLLHERRGTVKNRRYSISYNTENTLDIPTTYSSRGIEIMLEGRSTLSVEEMDDQRSFRRRTEASWKVIIEINPGVDGMDVVLPQYPDIHLEETEAVGDCDIDIKAVHRALFAAVNFSEIKEKLTDIFCGEWRYTRSSRDCYMLAQPAFAQDGAFVARLVRMKVDVTSSRRTNWSATQSTSHYNGEL